MKDSLFAQTKHEQRMVIIIVLLLLAVAIAKYLMRSHASSPTPSTISAPGVLSASPAAEERTEPGED